MRLISWLALLSLSAACASAQEAFPSSTITLGVGGAGRYDAAPVFRANYEYRWKRYLAFEAGTDISLIPTERYRLTSIQTIQPGVVFSSFVPTGQYFFTPYTDTRAPFMIPFALKGILPLNRGRVELFGGLGAAYVFNAAFYTQHHWLAQASLGARVSLDHERRFWLGTTWRGFSNFQSSYPAGHNDFSGTVDLGFRFGR